MDDCRSSCAAGTAQCSSAASRRPTAAGRIGPRWVARSPATRWPLPQLAGNGTWGDWVTLGGELTSDPVVARNSNGQLELLARGNSSALYQKRQSGVNGGWSEWAFLDGVVTSYLGLGQNSDGRLEVFARGT